MRNFKYVLLALCLSCQRTTELNEFKNMDLCADITISGNDAKKVSLVHTTNLLVPVTNNKVEYWIPLCKGIK